MAVSARQKVFLFGVVLALACLYLCFLQITETRSVPILTLVLSVYMTFLSGVTAAISFHVASQPCSKNITLKDLVILYVFGVIFYFVGKYKFHQFKNATKNPRKDQEKILFKVLRQNGLTEYGRKMGFENISTINEFRKRHQLSRYDQFEDYIERTAKGEDNVLLPNRPERLVLTSGTTGKPKKIPISKERTLHVPLNGFSVISCIARNVVTQKSLVQKMCSIYTHPTEYLSEAGIVMSAFTRLTKKDILPMMITPWQGFQICSEKDAMYVHAIFALKDEYLGTLQAPFCTFICSFFKVIESNWRDLVKDIATGTIRTDLNIPSHVRNELNTILEPEPIRAEQLQREFERGFDGITLRVWPHMQYLMGVVSPAFQAYADLLEQKYAKGVLLWSPFYISSESLLGVNLWPQDKEHKLHYLLFTDLTFFEFIPLDKSDNDQPGTLLIDEIQEGESYEMVITNIDGLYRFRFGDVIKVMGFYNKSPIIEIQFRIGDLINLRGEKMSEDCLRRALFDTVATLEAVVIDYSCAESHLVEAVQGVTKPAEVPYYVIFVEIQGKSGVTKKPKMDKEKFDDILRNQVPMYDYYRKMGGLGQAKVILVQTGSFKELRDYILDNSTASVMQFKMPRKLRKKEWIELLLNKCQ